jgi:hypothetical protein
MAVDKIKYRLLDDEGKWSRGTSSGCARKRKCGKQMQRKGNYQGVINASLERQAKIVETRPQAPSSQGGPTTRKQVTEVHT